MSFPFEVSFEAVETDIDAYVDKIFSNLDSEFLTLPKGLVSLNIPSFRKAMKN